MDRCVISAAKKAASLGFQESEMVAPSDVLTMIGAPEAINADISNMRVFNCMDGDGWADLMRALGNNGSAIILLGKLVRHSL